LAEEIKYPSRDEVRNLYDAVIRNTGGERGYLSKGNLDYILDTVKDVGERLRRRQAIIKKAAFLLYNTVVIHPFVNGNKRAGYELVRLFLRANGFELSVKNTEAYDFLLDVASGSKSETDVEVWLVRHLSEKREE